jgi:Sporulation and spore germination
VKSQTRSAHGALAVLLSTLALAAAILLPSAGASHAAGMTTSVQMYLIALNAAGGSGPRIGCGDSVVAVFKPIPPTAAPLTAAYRVLLNNHQRFYGQSGLYNALHAARLTLIHVAVFAGRAVIHLRGRLNLGGECDDPRAGAQLRRTALQFSTVRSVSIFINGVPLRRLLSGKG